MTILLSIFCIAAGMMMAWRPERVWEFQHVLSVKNGEPTNLFLAVCRICGTFVICFGVAALVYML
ncbi:DUF6199 family natural product biosynthesis protein [uncultured Dysosmobacter sp.]|uniref:DUF6199 family natural product biosynthesis protein n=1 Tax=uncultured Dysosmobacter sp. TaxID=2591384 RepID=UPI0026081F94|nr:DUF6199 family natural product biosynthesis protein [uncultured Dysosmobacter sp.]